MRKGFLFVLSACVVLGGGGNLLAQVGAKSNEWNVHVGWTFGDDLLDQPISGTTPELGDDFTLGVRYAYNFTKGWAIEGTLNWNLNTAESLPAAGGQGTDVDMDIFFIDINGVWHWNPEEKYVGYVTGGIGWALPDFDSPIQTGTTPPTIDDEVSLTANVGVGGKFFVSEAIHIRVEGKFRFVEALVDKLDDSLTIFEATVGVGWVF